MSLESVTQEWMENLDKISGLWIMAFRARAMFDALEYATLAEQTVPTWGAIAAGGGLIVAPAAAWVGILYAIGVPYKAARELCTEESSTIGIAEGYVMGLLGWQWSQAEALFEKHKVFKVYAFDPELDVVSVTAYNIGLRAGFWTAKALPADVRAKVLEKLRTLAQHPSAGNWSRLARIDFVIELAGAYQREVFSG